MEILQNNDFWFILAIVLSFLLMAYYFFSGQELDGYGVRVEGTVTNYWTETYDSGGDDMSTSTSHYLKAFFTDEERFVHSVEISVSTRLFRESVKTMSIKLIHPPGRPKKAQPVKGLYTPAIIWGGILIVTIAVYIWEITMN